MSKRAILDYLEEVEIVHPTDLVLRQIQQLIAQEVLKPGEVLPPERDLAEKLAVGRGYVRDALKKLEFYGVIIVRPNRRPIVADLGSRTLQSQISNMLHIAATNVHAIMEARVGLEIQASCLAAERATQTDCTNIMSVLDEHTAAIAQDEPSIEIDFLFHSRVAQAAHSPALLSLITSMVPLLFQQSRQFDICGGERRESSLHEHEHIAQAICSHNVEAARSAMERHMALTYSAFTAKEQK